MTSDEKLRVLHWNIHSWRDSAGASNTAAIATLIRETRPDAVSLVEVNEPWGAPGALAEISDACGYSWLFGPSLEFDEGGRSYGYGNALLTRVPVTAVQQWRVFSPGRAYDGTEPAEPRSVLLARLSLSTGSIWLGSTHFPASEPASRTIAAGTLRRLTRQLTGPWLICGDFNAESSALFVRDDGIAVSPDPAVPTYPAFRPTAAIDYCVAHPGVVMESAVLTAAGSDHLPVLTVAGQRLPDRIAQLPVLHRPEHTMIEPPVQAVVDPQQQVLPGRVSDERAVEVCVNRDPAPVQHALHRPVRRGNLLDGDRRDSSSPHRPAGYLHDRQVALLVSDHAGNFRETCQVAKHDSAGGQAAAPGCHVDRPHLRGLWPAVREELVPAPGGHEVNPLVA